MPLPFNRTELDRRDNVSAGPPTVGHARRTCGKCNTIHTASGTGGKIHKIFGWIGPCCNKPKEKAPVK